MRINTNISSLTAQENAVNTNNNLKSSLEKLSSGLKINKASDDASGLAIADKLRTQATSIDQGIANGNSAVTLLQIADKSMAEQSNILDTVKSKLIQANTDTTSDAGRESIRKDIKKLLTQLDNIASQTNYNGNVLLQQSAGTTAGDQIASDALNFQIGEDEGDIIANTAIQSNTLGLGGGTADMLGAFNTGETKKFDAQSTVVFTSDGTTKIRASGDLGTITAANTLTFSDLDEETAKVFDAIAASSGSDLTKTGGVYTLADTTTLDLSGVNVGSVTMTAAGADAITLATTETITVANIEADSTKTITVTGGGTVTGGDTLSTLKNLGADKLTDTLAANFQDVIDTAITELNGYRGDIGSTQNQVESAVRNLMTQSTNVKAAESIIRDVDYAAESANFNKQNIISQAGSYAMSQANATQQNVLRLLQ